MKEVKKGIPNTTQVSDVHYGFLVKEKESVLKEICNSSEFHNFMKPFMKSKRVFPEMFNLKDKDQVIQVTAVVHSFFITKGIKCSNPCFKTLEEWVKLIDYNLVGV